MQRETIYAAHRVQGIVGGLVFVVFALVAHSHGSNGLAIGFAAFGAFLVLLLLRRPRFEVGPDGLKVVNLARSYAIPWSDVEGLGYSGGRFSQCLTIRRRDGSSVNATVVTDDPRSGYSTERMLELVADLQRRLVATNGTGAAAVDFPPAGVEPRARRNMRRLNSSLWIVVCLFFLVFGIATAWHAASDLPHAYSRLHSHGVRATAVFAGCRATGIRDEHCRLSLAYEGRTRTWNYGQNFPQFKGLPVGAPVAVLVDPSRPETVYTLHDVDVRYDAGLGPLTIFGGVLALAGALGLAWSMWMVRRRSRATGSPALRVGG